MNRPEVSNGRECDPLRSTRDNPDILWAKQVTYVRRPDLYCIRAPL